MKSPRVKVALPSFKQLPLISTTIFALWINVNFGVRLSFNVAGDLMLSSDSFLDFYAKTLSLPVRVVKDWKSEWNTKKTNLVIHYDQSNFY